MTHRVETVIAAAVTAVTSLTTTGTNVFRGKLYEVQESELPCLHVEMGPENKAQEHINGEVDWNLIIKITATVRDLTAYEQTINTIREEIHVALRAAPKLGETFIIDTNEEDPDEIDINGGAQKPTVAQTFNWEVKYRRNIDNPSL